MTKRRMYGAGMLVLGATMLTGCRASMSIEDMKEMKPERPAAMNELNFLVGEWEGTGEAQMGDMDRTLKTTSTSTISWDLDDMVLVERGKFNMEEFDEDMEGINIWTYDGKPGRYRTYWADSMGGSATGTARYHERSDTWRFKSRIDTPHGTITGKGTMRLIDNNTMEWTWSESAMMGLIKISDFSGTARRVK